MPKIVITEQDLTTPGVVDESFDVVYVPGFVDSGNPSLWLKGTDETDATKWEYIGLAPNTPTLFKSVAEFEAVCGKWPVKFGTETYTPSPDQDLSELTVLSGAKPTRGPNQTTHYPEGMGNYNAYDSGYIMAKELLAAGLPVVYENIGKIGYPIAVVGKDDEVSVAVVDSWYKGTDTEGDGELVVMSRLVDDFYNNIESAFDTSNPVGIVDKGNFSIKYLTSGGYPLYIPSTDFSATGESGMTKMIAMAATRGDCVALIDYDAAFDSNINHLSADRSSLFQTFSDEGEVTDGEFATMFMPWATYQRVTSDVDSSDTTKKVSTPVFFPASFAYLKSLAHSIKTNANWLAIAGAARGSVRNLDELNVVIPNAVADAMQARTGTSINAITNIKPYGNTIWGNRTLKYNEENLTATSFLNIRNLVSDVKKTAYRSARRVTFEQDSDVMWLNFKTDLATLLDRMKSGYGISGYKIIRNYEHERAAEKATVCAKIVLYPTYAVEDFYIDVILKDGEVTIE